MVRLHNLTDEQRQIVESTANAKVEALAGTGKTTTLFEYVRHRDPALNVLYVVYNREMADTAKKKFRKQRNVTVKTAHSWAWKELGFGWPGPPIYKSFGVQDVMQELRLSNMDEARLHSRAILDLFNYFCHSSAADPEQVIPALQNHLGPCELSDYLARYASSVAASVTNLFQMMRTGQTEKITHDFYFKEFAMERAKEAVEEFDIVLADEAQDHNEVTASVLMGASGTTVFVGDSFQQIYAWRNAVNTLSCLENYRAFEITGSFRFGSRIADEISRIVTSISGRGIKLRGLGEDGETTYFRTEYPEIDEGWAYISRTNADLLRLADVATAAGMDIWVAGGIDSFKFDELEQILLLLNHRRPRHRLFRLFRDLHELREYCKQTNDQSMLSSIGLVEHYRNELPTLKNRLIRRHTSRKDADVVFSTAHRAKGCEFEKVKVVDNFARDILETAGGVGPSGWRAQEEVNLAYVAMTRAKSRLELPIRFRDLARRGRHPCSVALSEERVGEGRLNGGVGRPEAIRVDSTNDGDWGCAGGNLRSAGGPRRGTETALNPRNTDLTSGVRLYLLALDHLAAADRAEFDDGEEDVAASRRAVALSTLTEAALLGCEEARLLIWQKRWYQATSYQERASAREQLAAAFEAGSFCDGRLLSYFYMFDGRYEDALEICRAGVDAGDIFCAVRAAKLLYEGIHVEEDRVGALAFVNLFLEMAEDGGQPREEDEEFIEMEQLKEKLEDELSGVEMREADHLAAYWIWCRAHGVKHVLRIFGTADPAPFRGDLALKAG